RFAGAVSYSYTQGPDGKRYITGGEVPIHVPPSDDPEQALRDMEQVQRAALAPGNPSAQDRSVAAAAAAMAAQARQQLSLSAKEAGDAFKTGATSVKAGLRFEDIQSENIQSRDRPQSAIFSSSSSPFSTLGEPAGVYARHASKYGLWAWGRGFEPIAPISEEALEANAALKGVGLPCDFAA
ncbi:MAG: hypothetical protein LBS00_09385, partial [Synergistaceae bacterium]|nr:hypothetical protein [Synergistaceae bacterium]